MANQWTTQQIELLIDAYKEEMCLYATTEATYHNKHLRREALQRVTEAVTQLRPATTPAECQSKCHNLRNQFNVEHAKVRASYKSGTAADKIYQPQLWYYPKLLFLESYIKPRKSRHSLEQMDLNPASQEHTASPEGDSERKIFEGTEHISITPKLLDVTFQHTASPVGDCERKIFEGSDHISITPKLEYIALPSTSTSDAQQAGSVSPASSGSSSSSVAPRESKKRKHDSCDCAESILELPESRRRPVTINTGNMSSLPSKPIDSFVNFIGSLLHTFQDEELKLEVMNTISQIVFNAKTNDLHRSEQ